MGNALCIAQKPSASVDGVVTRKNVDSTPLSPSQKLREGAKNHKPKPIRKKNIKPHKIIKVNQPYWDAMKQYNLNTPQRATSKIYKNVDYDITKLRKGTYFDGVPGCEHLIGREITVEDFTLFCKHMSLAIFSSGHTPNSRPVKEAWGKWYLDRMLYNNTSTNTKCKSLFATYLDTPPPKVKSVIQLKDTNPDYTDYVIQACKRVFDWDLGNGDRAAAIKCANRLSKFFTDNKYRISMYDIHYRFTNQQVDELLTMIEKNESPDYPAKPVYLYGNLTYDKLLLEHLDSVGSLMH